MLINKSPTAGDIVAIKLITGDEIVAKLKTDNGQALVVSKPIAIGMSQNGLALVPFMFGSDDDAEMVFATNMIVTYVMARKEIKDVYIQNTTGITPASGPSEGFIKG